MATNKVGSSLELGVEKQGETTGACVESKICSLCT